MFSAFSNQRCPLTQLKNSSVNQVDDDEASTCEIEIFAKLFKVLGYQSGAQIPA